MSFPGNRLRTSLSRMKRGEVWWVEFDPSVGTEICKTRPAVIVSNDAAALIIVAAAPGRTRLQP
ncbi:type II toxin-antitoxin system PemK/MazF family toxin, partial [uncultured Thiodictyon sp.]|uniref:type II toxin-antitoxin system PemK/MazF family toxin n=1 Tax=uncultured Thiodictyon sp. TaxID=1846217 RepID=UPI0034593452